jgi:anaerobic ribonucleoside-triphosphate reductase activating protein
MMSDKLQLAAFLPRSRVNGPGIRAVVWVQGCPFRCPGCFNERFLPFAGGTSTLVEELAAQILADEATEGVTFSGGEPFAHAAALALLAAACQAAGKSVVVFSGYRFADLQGSRHRHQQALLAVTDLLIAGPYELDNPSPHPLLSSANQELVHLTARYCDYDFGPPRRRVEYRIAGGVVTTTGFPSTTLTTKEPKACICQTT